MEHVACEPAFQPLNNSIRTVDKIIPSKCKKSWEVDADWTLKLMIHDLVYGLYNKSVFLNKKTRAQKKKKINEN